MIFYIVSILILIYLLFVFADTYKRIKHSDKHDEDLELNSQTIHTMSTVDKLNDAKISEVKSTTVARKTIRSAKNAYTIRLENERKNDLDFFLDALRDEVKEYSNEYESLTKYGYIHGLFTKGGYKDSYISAKKEERGNVHNSDNELKSTLN